MSDNDNITPIEKETTKPEEASDKIENKEVKEQTVEKELEKKDEKQEKENEEKGEKEEEKEVKKEDEKEEEENEKDKDEGKEEEKKEEKENKNEENKEETNKDNDEEDSQKKLSKAINELKSDALKAKSLFLYDINEEMKSQYHETYYSEKTSIELKELDNFLNYFNKIREAINTSSKESILSLIENENKEKYSLNEDDNSEFSPIKDFWYKSLMNAKFFDFSEKDKKVLENLRDMNFIPLKPYPSFRVEFIFEDNNKYFIEKENIISKAYIFEENDKDLIKKSEGCKIKWKSDELNPTLKTIIKKKKKGKEYSSKNVESFFNIFGEKDSDINKDLVEAKFFRGDFFINMLEYYLNIMEIQFHEEEDN